MRKQINFIFNNLKIFNMGENDEKDKPNAYGFMDRFRNAVLGAAMADRPEMMTASGWRLNEKGDYVLDQQNDPHVILLRDNLAAEGAGVMLGEFGIPAAYGLYNLGIRGLGKAGSNWARAKLISKEMLNISPSSKEGLPLNVGWGPKQTIKVTHATDSKEPLRLFFDKRYDVTREGANPFGVWYLGKWGLPRTAATNSLPGKAEKAARARKVFEDRKYKLTGEVTLDKPLTTVGEVPNRSTLSYDAEKMGADGIIYNNVYDNGYDNNQVILSHKLHVPSNKKGSKIHIKKKNRGKFTEYCGGKVTNECILKAKKSKNPTLRKRATFALNARGWSKKHLEGGSMTQKQIAQTTEYGWKGLDNLKERLGKFSSVNPGHSFYNPFHWFGDGWRYIMGENRDEFSTPHEEAMYFRYMGGKRDMEHLPYTSVRFSRDYDENNKVNKTKEFVGVPKDQKDAVRDYVIPTMLDDLKEGEWVLVKDDVRFNRDVRGTGNRLSAYGKFGLRNNNNSGIYDFVDTYDFPNWIPIPDRNKGYELEVRDTIWTKDAKPELYRTEKGYYPYNKQPQK